MRIRTLVALLSLIFVHGVVQAEKQMIDYFLPMEPQGPLVSEGIWGNPNVLPRDIKNGLEDSTLESWCYWDGAIVKADDDRYHMYASCWAQTNSHSTGWKVESKAMHAVSDNPIGPYKHIGGLTWPDWQNGKGGNVIGLRMHDGRYAMVTSEITSGEVFVSDSPDGPFQLLGKIEIDLNGFNPGLARYGENNKGAVKNGTVGCMANVQILLRPDGRYMIVPRSTAIMISENGILGPYKIRSEPVYKDMPEVQKTNMEDPSVWYSGGLYHMTINYHLDNVTYHLTSEDGIHDWTYRGIAFRNDIDFFKYTDGTVNHWPIVQRMTVFVENGHPTHFLFSVIDSRKGEDGPNDKNGSKIVIVPFDGEAFDRDMQELLEPENTNVQ
ncbi:glycoside hydrolase family protein [Pontiella sulfatireligans]|uniref:Uncharacterized protein n=1 Tax=Pontiella sulfatireligans TaxID=2750658 RepID=A0A6C2UKD6_9BACT|nr:glycoside hydrolase family protein [Pontiella sulfatireligans]VGO20429.1 hypothetical protein SCARR_02492 [Pontiella sulfatireligans]